MKKEQHHHHQTTTNRNGARAVLDALARTAGPRGLVVVDDDFALAVHGEGPGDDHDHDQHGCARCHQQLVGALRALCVSLGEDSPRGLSVATGLAYQHAVATLRRFDQADVDQAEHAANAAARRAV